MSLSSGAGRADSARAPIEGRCPWIATKHGEPRGLSELSDQGSRVGTLAAGERRPATGFRVILTTGLVALYLAGCLAALALLAQIWAPSL